MSYRLHIPVSNDCPKQASAAWPSKYFCSLFIQQKSKLFLAGIIASLLAFTGTYALCQSHQEARSDQKKRSLLSQITDYSYYDVAYDDAQNLKLAKDSLDDRYSRNLHAISLAFLSRIWEYQPREQLKKLNKQWNRQKYQLSNILSGHPSPAEKSKALARYDLFLSRASENFVLKDMITFNQEIFEAYQSELSSYLEDAKGFGIRVSEAKTEASLNPQYYKDMKSAFYYMNQLQTLQSSLESAIQSRHSGEIPAPYQHVSWTLSDIQIPLFIQKIYRYTVGKQSESVGDS